MPSFGWKMARAAATEATGNLFFNIDICPSRSITGAGQNHNAKSCVSFGTTKRLFQVQALVDRSSDGAQDNVNNFVKRIEQAWAITKQPRPVQCKSCEAVGQVECPWCKGTGFFILGDNMLCEVPSRNTTCKVCFGQGTLRCEDCKGTGFRAKWLGDPGKSEEKGG